MDVLKYEQAAKSWNGLSAEQKQGVWNSTVERLSKVDVSELSIPEQTNVDGGSYPTGPIISPLLLLLKLLS